MNKHWKMLVLLVAAMSVNVRVSLAQNVRWDYIALTTTGAGQAVPLLALPGTGVSFFTCTGGVCTTPANTFPSASSTTACPSNAQVVLALDSTCVSTADFQGNFGAWFLPGQYAYTLLIAGLTYGPYPFTIGGGSGGSGTVGSGTAGQIAQYPANGTSVGGVTVSGDATLANGGALTLKTVNSNVGNCGDATHVGQITLNAKGLATGCAPVAISFPSAGPTLQTNSVNNSSQTVLNISGGAGINVTNPTAGNVFITSTVVAPASAVVLSSNSSAQLVAAAVQGNGTKVQLAAGTTTTGDLVSYDANGNAIDSTVAVSNVGLLNGTQTWTGTKNTFSAIAASNVTDSALTSGDLVAASTGGLLFNGPALSNIPLLNGTQTWTGQNFFNFTTNFTAQTQIVNNTPATSGANVNSPIFEISGNFFNGGASTGDGYTWQVLLGSGTTPTSTLSLTHFGSTGPFIITIPNLALNASSLNNSVGVQAASASGCTFTAGAIGNNCLVTVHLNPVEPDTNYRVMGCSVTNPAVSQNVVAGAPGSFTTSSFELPEIALDASTTGMGTMNCFVVHN